MNIVRVFKRVFVDVAWAPLVLLTLLCPRNPRLWMFGSSSGHRYADHSRMLYEYLYESQDTPGIDVIWSTKSDAVYKELTRRGCPVIQANSLSGFFATLRSGVCIYTHYAHDHNRIAAFGAYKIQLWHGIPLKRFKAVSGLLEKGNTGRRFRKLHNWMLNLQKTIFPWANPTWDLLVFQSEVDRDRTGQAFYGTYRRGIVAGSVRVEYLKKHFPLDREEVERKENRILYAPTHRVLGRESLFEKVPVPEGEKLTAELRRMHATLDVRLHPFQEREPVPDVLKIAPARHIENSPCNDIYEDLHAYHVLITDYSSIFIDVLPLGMPIVFLAPDHQEYSEDDQGFFSENFSVPGPVAMTWEEALYYCDEILNNGHDSWEKSREEAANFYFGDHHGGQSAMENIIDEANSDLKLS